MTILDDIRYSYVQMLDAADHCERIYSGEYGAGLVEAYTRAAAVLREIQNKYEVEYNDHPPLT